MAHVSRPRTRSQRNRLLLAAALIGLTAAPAGTIEKASEQVSAFYGGFSHPLPVELPGFDVVPRWMMSVFVDRTF